MSIPLVKKIVANPWVWIFFITALFQIFRGSLGDAVIFGLATALIAAATTGFARANILERKQVRLLLSLPAVVTLIAVLTVIPRHTGVQAAIFLVILTGSLALVWHKDDGVKLKAEKDVKYSRIVWAALCVGLMLWEFAANIFGQLVDSLSAFPTISVLVDPMLDTIWGQGGFAAIWLLIGFGLLRLGSRR